MEAVKLKNGAEEPVATVRAAMFSFEKLWNNDPIAAFELVTVCRDPSHKPFGNAGVRLKDLALMQPDGGVHGSIRNIVLSAVSGDGLDMTIGSPLAS